MLVVVSVRRARHARCCEGDGRRFVDMHDAHDRGRGARRGVGDKRAHAGAPLIGRDLVRDELLRLLLVLHLNDLEHGHRDDRDEEVEDHERGQHGVAHKVDDGDEPLGL